MEDELLYRVALTMIPDLGPVRTGVLVARFGNARSVFNATFNQIASLEGIGAASAKAIEEWNGFGDAREELLFMARNDVRPIFITDPDYPARLLNCYDPPPLLYFRGSADLNHARILSIIGTRNNTEYGKQVTEQLVQALQPYHVIIASGLAFGIDSVAHKAALHCGIPTIGVLGHGLDTLYPNQNRTLAKEMIANGGLLTEFPRNTRPDRHNFPRRNRIVAGMADATVVIETASKGGSMITAELAAGYNRDVFAVPGRISDAKSAGCNLLVTQNRAILFTGADQLLETMGWNEKKKTSKKQKAMFVDLSPDEEVIVGILREAGTIAVDDLTLRSGFSSSRIAAALLRLEIENVILSLPGKICRLA